MAQEKRFSYIANIFDKVKIVYPESPILNDDAPIINEYPPEQSNRQKYQYINHRDVIYCKCGHSFECKINNSSDTKHEYKLIPIKCTNCNFNFESFSDVKNINLPFLKIENIVGFRMIYFDNEKSIVLSKYYETVFVSLHSKKIIYKTFKNRIVIRKKDRAIFAQCNNHFNNKNSFHRIGFKALHRYINLTYCDINNYYQNDLEKAQKYIYSGIENFLEHLSKLINPKDLEKINILFGKQEKEYKETEDKKTLKRDLIKERTTIYLALILYPSFSTLLPKNIIFLIDLISSSFLENVTPKDLKTANPTTPHKIIETLIKISLKNSWKKDKSFIDDKKELCKKIHISKNVYQKISDPSSVGLFIEFCMISIEKNKEKKFQITIEDLYCYINRFKNFDDIMYTVVRLNYVDYPISKFELNYILKCCSKIKDLITTKWDDYNMFLQHFRDCKNMLIQLKRNTSEIFKYKNLNDLKIFHDLLVKDISLLRTEQYNVKLKENLEKYKYLSGVVINNITFDLLDSNEKIIHESTEMNHCIKSYINHMADGYYIAFSIFDKITENRATLGIDIRNKNPDLDLDLDLDGEILRFDQLKAKHNARATNRIIDAVTEFLKFYIYKNINISIINNDLTKQETIYTP